MIGRINCTRQGRRYKTNTDFFLFVKNPIYIVQAMNVLGVELVGSFMPVLVPCCRPTLQTKTIIFGGCKLQNMNQASILVASI